MKISIIIKTKIVQNISQKTYNLPSSIVNIIVILSLDGVMFFAHDFRA